MLSGSFQLLVIMAMACNDDNNHEIDDDDNKINVTDSCNFICSSQSSAMVTVVTDLVRARYGHASVVYAVSESCSVHWMFRVLVSS